MFKKIIERGRKLILEPQGSVLSAASLIMVMIIASRVLGLVRQRVLANFFPPDELSLFFAAFRLPDLIFEILVFGTFSSAFIPVFTKSLKTGEKIAWETAGRVINLGLIIFAFFALIFGLYAQQIYTFIAPGYSQQDIVVIAKAARILFFAQGFFIVSYVLTGVLESLRRFFVPALAPVFYNLGIILGTIFLSPKLGLLGPSYGVVIGAFSHFMIQLPFARKLGFRFVAGIRPTNEVKKIGKLALPRVIDLSFDQIGQSVELYLASIISTASYTYFTFANSLQLLPVGLFGTSLAKAALPILSRNEDNPEVFRKILLDTVFQSIFFTAPIAVVLIVLRVPIIRLVYGTNIFDWTATVQTGLVLSVFAFGVVFQTMVSILGRGFFALHDTKTPVVVSMIGLTILVICDFILVKGFHFTAWALAASFSLGMFVESICLFSLMHKKVGKMLIWKSLFRVVKAIIASVASGLLMYFILKVFDKSVWVKRLSFLTQLESTKNLPFEKFVLDTRYTVNLLILTIVVSIIGFVTYVLVSAILRSDELAVFLTLLKRIFVKKQFTPIPEKETETVAPTPNEQAE